MRWIPVIPSISRIVFLFATCRAWAGHCIQPSGQSSGTRSHRVAYDPAARAHRPDLSPIVDTPRNTPYFNDLQNPRKPRFEGHLMDQKLLIRNFVGRLPAAVEPLQHAVASTYDHWVPDSRGSAPTISPVYPGSLEHCSGRKSATVVPSSSRSIFLHSTDRWSLIGVRILLSGLFKPCCGVPGLVENPCLTPTDVSDCQHAEWLGPPSSCSSAGTLSGRPSS